MTSLELVGLWLDRDRRYAARTPLSPAEIESVTAWRRSEVDALPAKDRSVPWSVLTRWSPPVKVR